MWNKILRLVAGEKLVDNWYVGKAVEKAEKEYCDKKYETAWKSISNFESKYGWPILAFMRSRILCTTSNVDDAKNQVEGVNKSDNVLSENGTDEIEAIMRSEGNKLEYSYNNCGAVREKFCFMKAVAGWKPLLLCIAFDVVFAIFGQILFDALVRSSIKVDTGTLNLFYLSLSVVVKHLLIMLSAFILFLLLSRMALNNRYSISHFYSLFSDFRDEISKTSKLLKPSTFIRYLPGIAVIALVGSLFANKISILVQLKTVDIVVVTLTYIFAQLGIINYLLMTVYSRNEKKQTVKFEKCNIIYLFSCVLTICLMPFSYINGYPISISLAFIWYVFLYKRNYPVIFINIIHTLALFFSVVVTLY